MTYQELVKKVQTALVKADASGITEHIAVQVNVTGDAAGAFYIEVRDGVLYVEPYDYNDRDCLLTGDSKEILAIAQGKNNLKEAIMDAHVYCDGNYDKISLLSDIIPKKVKKPRTPKAETAKTAEKAKTSEKSEKTEEKATAKKSRKIKAEKPAETAEKPAATKKSRKPKTEKTEKTVETAPETATDSVSVAVTVNAYEKSDEKSAAVTNVADIAKIADVQENPVAVTEVPETVSVEIKTEEPEAEITDAPEIAPDVTAPETAVTEKKPVSNSRRATKSTRKTTPADAPDSTAKPPRKPTSAGKSKTASKSKSKSKSKKK